MDCKDYTTHKIRTLHHDIKIAFDSEFEKLGLTGQQGVFLIYICKNQSVHQNDLEQQFGLSKSTVSGIIKRMLNKNIITKSSDYPFVTIKPTENGIRLLEKMNSVRDSINKKLFEGFNDEEKANFISLLERAILNIKED